MSENKFQTKTNNIAQLCYQDPVTHEWIPVTEITPLPITGVGTSPGQPLNIRIIGDNGEAVDVVQMPDGSYALKVDTELIVNVDNVSIGNIKVGTDGVNDTKLSTTATGLVKVVDQNGNPLTDIRQLTVGDSIKIYGSDNGTTARLIKTDVYGAVDVISTDLYGILTDVLKELKKLNLQMSLLTDTIVTNNDVEV